MNCPNCNTVNNEDSKFCIGCGTKLEATPSVAPNPTAVEPAPTPQVNQVVTETPVQQNVPQPVQMQPTQAVAAAAPVNTVSLTLNYFMYCLLVLLKPNKVFKEEESKLSAPKNGFILSAIVEGAMMLVNLFTSMLGAVRETSIWTDEVKWNFANLSNLNYLELIGKNLLIYLGVILAIAGIFYLGSLIAKKQTNFIKLLSISATAIIPVILGHMILSPILSLIWNELGIIVSAVSIVYAVVLLYELMNNELKLEGDIKVYFNLAIFSILMIAGYYAFTNLLVSNVTSELDDIMNMFNY